MAFSTQCYTKGCNQFQEPYLENDKVYCSSCDNEITNITQFVKQQMKMSKQVRKPSKVPFAVKCDKCNNDDKPKILNNDIVCARCNSPLDNLSESFKIMLKDKLKTTDRDV